MKLYVKSNNDCTYLTIDKCEQSEPREAAMDSLSISLQLFY